MSQIGLLEPCTLDLQYQSGHTEEIEGWQFLRETHHWYRTNIPQGSFLYEAQAPSVAHTDRRPEPWTVQTAHGVTWGIPEDVAKSFLREDSLERDPRYQEALARLPGDRSRLRPPCVFVERDVVEIGLRRGDVLLKRDRGRFLPRSVPLSLGDLGYLRDRFLQDRSLLTSLNPYDFRERAIRAISDRRTWGRKRTNVAVLKGISTFSIRASSDQAAIFELVLSVGGQMPSDSRPT